MSKQKEDALNDELAEKWRNRLIKLARLDCKVRDGELEIDNNAVVSWGDPNGAYVQAWLWVDCDRIPPQIRG